MTQSSLSSSSTTSLSESSAAVGRNKDALESNSNRRETIPTTMTATMQHTTTTTTAPTNTASPPPLSSLTTSLPRGWYKQRGNLRRGRRRKSKLLFGVLLCLLFLCGGLSITLLRRSSALWWGESSSSSWNQLDVATLNNKDSQQQQQQQQYRRRMNAVMIPPNSSAAEQQQQQQLRPGRRRRMDVVIIPPNSGNTSTTDKEAAVAAAARDRLLFLAESKAAAHSSQQAAEEEWRARREERRRKALEIKKQRPRSSSPAAVVRNKPAAAAAHRNDRGRPARNNKKKVPAPSLEELRREYDRRMAEGTLFNYSLPAHPQPNVTLPDPKLYSRNVTTIYIVMSARKNFDHRRAIRKSWGLGHPLYFIVGGPTFRKPEPLELVEQLFQEAKDYGDLLDVWHPDHYHSLPYKLHFAYRWVTQHLPWVQWIVKLDDDMTARLRTIENTLLELYNPELPVLIGRIMVRASPFRQGKWAEPVYPKGKYPMFPLGSCGHIVSRPVAQQVGQLTNLHYYQGEDTSLGIWIHEKLPDLQPWWIHTTLFHNDGKCENPNYLIVGHMLSPAHLRKCHAKLDEWKHDRLDDPDFKYWFAAPRMHKLQLRQILMKGF